MPEVEVQVYGVPSDDQLDGADQEKEQASLITGERVPERHEDQEAPAPKCSRWKCATVVSLCGAAAATLGILIPRLAASPLRPTPAGAAPATAVGGGTETPAGVGGPPEPAPGPPEPPAQPLPEPPAPPAEPASEPGERPPAATPASSSTARGEARAPSPSRPWTTASQTGLLDFGSRSFNVRALEVPVSRSVLALGVPKVIGWLRKPRFEVIYMEMRGERLLEQAFRAGWPGIVWHGLKGLPFNNLGLDMVIVGRDWCVDGCSARVIDEWARVLRPKGKLLVWDYPELLGSLAGHELLRRTQHGNVFTRAEQVVPGIPTCPNCTKQLLIYNGTRWQWEERCQPYIPIGYLAPDSEPRLSRIKSAGAVEMARSWFPREENTNLNKWNWLDHVRNRQDYLGKKKSYGRRHAHSPLGWEAAWFYHGRGPRRILDAGAGTCSGSSWMASEGLLAQRLYFNYGYYDCSMAAVCSERGSPILSWDWNVPLPVCSSCKFDLVNQVGGMHHQSLAGCPSGADDLHCTKQAYERLLGNFDRVVACGGFMWLWDGPALAESGNHWPWWVFTVAWARLRNYRIVDRSTPTHGRLRLDKIC